VLLSDLPSAEVATKLVGFSISEIEQKYTSRTASYLDATKTYHSTHIALKKLQSVRQNKSCLKICVKWYLDCVWDVVDEDACI